MKRRFGFAPVGGMVHHQPFAEREEPCLYST